MKNYLNRQTKGIRQEWTRCNEFRLKLKVSSALRDLKIPHLREFRIYDIHGFSRSINIDIAVFLKSGEPLIAVELKNKDDRNETVRGLGQSLIYKFCGFPHVALATPMGNLAVMNAAAKSAGIDVIAPWNAIE